MLFRPLFDRLLIKRCDAESVTPGGIHIPDNAKEKALEAEVIAVGSGRILDGGGTEPIPVNVGDRVLFGKYAGDEVRIDGEEYIVIREADILGVLGSK